MAISFITSELIQWSKTSDNLRIIIFVLLKYFIAIGPQLRGFPIYTRLSCAVNYPLSWFKGKFRFNELIQKESCKDVFYPKTTLTNC